MNHHQILPVSSESLGSNAGSASTLGLSGVGRGRSRPWEGQASTSGYGMNSSYNTYGNSGYGGSSYGGYNSGILIKFTLSFQVTS